MEESTLIVWFGENGIQLFRVPAQLAEYLVCDGCYLNYTNLEPGSELAADSTEHLAYLLGLEPYYGKRIPSLAEFLQYRQNNRNAPRKWEETSWGDEGHERATPLYAGFEILGPLKSPLTVGAVIRCGWLA